MRVVSQYVANKNNAGPKAKIDIEKILKQYYNAKIYTNKVNDFKPNFFSKIKKFFFSRNALKTNDFVVIQIPFSNKTEVLKLAKNKIGMIHDLDGIRFQNEKLLREEINCLNMYKYVIVHNEIMKEYLISKGLKVPAISIELFDYLVNEENEEKKEKRNFNSQNPIIAYPGNLEKRKAEFIYDLNEEKMNFKLLVYGNYFEKEDVNNKKIEYKGAFSPDVIPNKIEGDLGLVWSGMLDESDENLEEKAYNKYNIPHKLSCYLAAGMPVIVWQKAAASKIVDKYNIGYKINNLYDINKIDFYDYKEKKKNVEILSKKIKGGYFTKTALDKILKEIK